MTTEIQEQVCDRCFQKFPNESLVSDTFDSSMSFCASCQEVTVRKCAYCLFSTTPSREAVAVPGWMFGVVPDHCWNPACESCIVERKLHRRIDTERMSARKALRMLSDQLRAEGLEEEGLYTFDYEEEKKILDKSLQWWRWTPCYVVTGSNEGHYVHIDVLRRLFSRQEEETHLLASIKTFQGRRKAYEVAIRCAELLGA